jgi:nitrite reductase (cytochrome c-552)
MGWKYPVELPDISTKDKAQEVIGLNMEFLIEDKQNFLNSTAVDWDKNARERQGTLKEYKQSD